MEALFNQVGGPSILEIFQLWRVFIPGHHFGWIQTMIPVKVQQVCIGRLGR